jgi:ABC-type nitrate/sulfonate/bicarbonate transport system permease component
MVEARLIRSMPGSWSVDAGRVLQIGTLIGLLAFWEAIGASGLLYRGVVPSSFRILASLAELLASPRFWFNLSVTGIEVASALAVGGGLGILAGLLLGGIRFVGKALEPYVNFLASMPKIILFPVFLVAFGIGPGSKIAIGAVACFFPMALGTAAGTRHIDPVLIRVGRSFNLTLVQMIWMVYLPALIAPIMSGLRIALGVAIVVCLLAEIKFSNVGIGFMVINSYNQSRFADVYAVLIVIFLIAVGMNALLERFERAR